MSSPQLIDDVWLAVLSFLDESYVDVLRLCGDKRLVRLIGRRTSERYYLQTRSSGSDAAIWPPRVTAASPVTDLEVTYLSWRFYPADVSGGILQLENFPRTLTRLSCHFGLCPSDDLVRPFPFCVGKLEDVPIQRAAIDAHFPHLHTFHANIWATNRDWFWLLPSSLTYFSATDRGYQFHESIPFPPNLAHLFLGSNLSSGRGAGSCVPGLCGRAL